MALWTASSGSAQGAIFGIDEHGRASHPADEASIVARALEGVPSREAGLTDVILFCVDGEAANGDSWMRDVVCGLGDVIRAQDAPHPRALLFAGWFFPLPAGVLEDDRHPESGSRARIDWADLPLGQETFPLAAGVMLAEGSHIDAVVDRHAQLIAGTAPAREALRTILSAGRSWWCSPRLHREVIAAYGALVTEAEIVRDRRGRRPRREQAGSLLGAVRAGAGTVEGIAVPTWWRTWGSVRRDLLAPLRRLALCALQEGACRFGERDGSAQLERLLGAAGGARFHIFGQGSGCLVVLEALLRACEAGAMVRPVDSVCLARGMLSLWSLADTIPFSGGSGYFNPIRRLGWVRGPILASYAPCDGVSVGVGRRGSGGEEDCPQGPSDFPALGTMGRYGVRGCADTHDLPVGAVGAPHAFRSGHIYNLDTSDTPPAERGGVERNRPVVCPAVSRAFGAAVAAAGCDTAAR